MSPVVRSSNGLLKIEADTIALEASQVDHLSPLISFISRKRERLTWTLAIPMEYAGSGDSEYEVGTQKWSGQINKQKWRIK